MNLENIKEKMTVKNYKEMCRLLGEPICEGNSKRAQINEWMRYFNFDKKGHQYIIREIYPTPRWKRAKMNTKYIANVETIILYYLLQNGGEQRLTASELYLELNMVNENYLSLRKQTKENLTALAKRLSISENIILNHGRIIRKRLNLTLMSDLASMKKRGLIEYFDSRMIVFDKDFPREATHSELRNIMQVEKEALVIMGYETMEDVYRRWKIQEYYSTVNTLLSALFPGEAFKYAYRVIHISYAGGDVQIDRERICREDLKRAQSELRISSKIMLTNEMSKKKNGRRNDGWENVEWNGEKLQEGMAEDEEIFENEENSEDYEQGYNRLIDYITD